MFTLKILFLISCVIAAYTANWNIMGQYPMPAWKMYCIMVYIALGAGLGINMILGIL